MTVYLICLLSSYCVTDNPPLEVVKVNRLPRVVKVTADICKTVTVRDGDLLWVEFPGVGYATFTDEKDRDLPSSASNVYLLERKTIYIFKVLKNCSTNLFVSYMPYQKLKHYQRYHIKVRVIPREH